MSSDSIRWSDVPDRNGSLSSSPLSLPLTRAVQAWRLLEYSGAYLAFVAGVEILLVQALLSLPASPAPLVGALVTFAVYANDRLVDLDTDALTAPRRTAFVRRYRRHLYVLAAFAYGLAGAIAAFGGPLALALTLLPGAVWVVYAVNWIPVSGLHVERLKELVVVNSTLVAAAWSLPIVLLPMAYANAPLTPVAALLFGYFLLATFVNTEIANVRDVKSDAQCRVSTIPSAVGVDRARLVLVGVTLLVTGVLGVAAATDSLSAAAVLALALAPAELLVLLWLLGRVEAAALSVAAELTRVPVFVALVFLVA